METTRFREKARIFKGVLLTEDNLQEVAKWCDGEVRCFNGKWFLKIVDTQNDLVINPGSWVFQGPDGRYSMVNDIILEENFEAVDKPVTFQSEDELEDDDIPSSEVVQEGPSEALEGPSERFRGPKPYNPKARH